MRRWGCRGCRDLLKGCGGAHLPESRRRAAHGRQAALGRRHAAARPLLTRQARKIRKHPDHAVQRRSWRAGRLVGHTVAHARSKEQNARRSAYRQGEAVGASQSRIEPHQDQDGGRQGGDAIPGAARAERDNRDQAHHQGAQDAGRRARDHGEGDHRRAREDRPRGQRQARQPGEGEHDAGDDGQIRAAYRCQVRESGVLEVGRDGRVHAGDVTDHEAGQETSLVGWQDVGRIPETGAEVPGQCLDRRRPGDHTRRAADDQHGADELAGVRLGQASGHLDLLAGQEGAPVVPGGEDDHRRVDGMPYRGRLNGRPRMDGCHHRLDHDAFTPDRPAAGSPYLRVVRDLQPCRHKGATCGEIGHDAGGDAVDVESHHGGGRGGAAQDGDHGVAPRAEATA